jgi:hypothetical protein
MKTLYSESIVEIGVTFTGRCTPHMRSIATPWGWVVAHLISYPGEDVTEAGAAAAQGHGAWPGWGFDGGRIVEGVIGKPLLLSPRRQARQRKNAPIDGN